MSLAENSYRKYATRTAALVAAALAFAAALSLIKGTESGIEFVSGYVLELCLSIDNLIVFILLFESFQIPKKQQEYVLNYGIIGAVLLRGIFILLGSVAVENFKQILALFAAVLLYSSYKVLFQGESDGDKEDISKNPIVIFAKKYLRTSDSYDGDKFFTIENGKTLATPLLLCLICVELSDILFAFDSVPAIFGITKDAFVVYTSNIFAIMGLRSLFGVLSTAVDELQYLDKAVGVVLAIIAAKLGAEVFGVELLSPLQSLAVVIAVLGTGVVASLMNKKTKLSGNQRNRLNPRGISGIKK